MTLPTSVRAFFDVSVESQKYSQFFAKIYCDFSLPGCTTNSSDNGPENSPEKTALAGVFSGIKNSISSVFCKTTDFVGLNLCKDTKTQEKQFVDNIIFLEKNDDGETSIVIREENQNQDTQSINYQNQNPSSGSTERIIYQTITQPIISNPPSLFVSDLSSAELGGMINELLYALNNLPLEAGERVIIRGDRDIVRQDTAQTEVILDSITDSINNINALPNLGTVGVLTSGSIADGFGPINIGSQSLSAGDVEVAGNLTLDGQFGTANQVLTSTGTGTPPIWSDAVGVGGLSMGDTVTSATLGSIFFAGTGGVLAQDNANLFWDDTNNRLGLGSTTPGAKLGVAGNVLVDDYVTASNFIATSTTATSTFTRTSFSGVADFTSGINLDGLWGSSGQVLTSRGTGTDPIWSTVTSGAGVSIGDTITGGTTGSILFVDGSGQLSQSNSQLYWDTVNSRLGIGSSTPGAKLGVDGSLLVNGTTTSTVLHATSSLRVVNDIVTDITGSGLSISSGALTVGSLTTSHFSSANISQWTNDSGYITATLTEEEVEDFVGGMVTGNTETLITVTYEDGDGTIDFVVDNNLANYDNSTSGFLTSISGQTFDTLSDVAFPDPGADRIVFWDDSDSQYEPLVPNTGLSISGNNLDVSLSSFTTDNLTQGSTNLYSQWATATGGINYAGGNVGVGTTTPWAYLSLNPSGISGPAFAIGSSTGTNFVVTNGGRVGIGTTTPGERFSVAGRGLFDDYVIASRFVATSTTATSTFAGGATFNTGGGNFGIGTSSPIARLHVVDKSLGLDSSDLSQSAQGYFAFEGEDARIGLFSENEGGHGSTISLAEVNSGTYQDQWSWGRLSSGSGSSLVSYYGTSPDYSLNTRMLTFTPASYFVLPVTTSRLGIGGSPLTALHVEGEAGQDVILENISGGGTGAGWGINAGTDIIFSSASDVSSTFTEVVRFTNDGKVGIGGIANPVAPLEISSTNSENLILQDSNSTGAGVVSYMSFDDSAGTRKGYVGDGASGDSNIYLASDAGGIVLSASSQTAILTSAGLFGIGTSSPYAKLSVVGEIVGAYFTGTTTATSTFGGSIAVTETNATSTFAGGIDISDGCFAIDGVCLSTGAGSLAIGSSITSGTTGSVLFVDGSNQLAQDNANFYWDDTNNRIGFASTTPWAQLSVNPNGISGPAFAVGSSTSTSFVVTNGGRVGIATTSPWAEFSINPNGISGPSFAIGSSTSTHFVVRNNGAIGIGSTTGSTLPSARLSLTTSSNTVANDFATGIHIDHHVSPNNTFGTSTAVNIYSSPGTADNMVGIFNRTSNQYNQSNYGLYNLMELGDEDSEATGVFNHFEGGSAGLMYGVRNLSTADSGWDATTIYGLHNDLATYSGAGAITNNVYGTYTIGRTFSTGTKTFYGNYVTSGSDSTGGTQYGNYVDLTPGTATKYPGIFLGGNFGIGTTTPYAPLSVVGQIVGAYFTGTTTATSTFGGSIAVTEANATSTFAGGIDLSNGCLAINGTCIGGGSGTPGGSNTQLQYNNNGSFGGITGFTTDGTNLSIDAASTVSFSSGLSLLDNGIISTNSSDGLIIQGGGGTDVSVYGSTYTTIQTAHRFSSTGVALGSATTPNNTLAVIGNASIGTNYNTAAPTNGLIVEGFTGIGTTSPWAQLSVNPNGIAGPAFAIGSSTSTHFVVTNGGDVGIGLTSPQTNFHISESNTGTTPTVEIEQLSTGDVALQFSIPNEAYAIGIDNSDSDKFKISHSTSEGTAVLGSNDRLVIDGDGNIGIGTSSPYAKLSVVGPVVAQYFHATSTATSTFGGSIAVTETNATSTFAGGIDISDGCYAIDGVCLSTSGGMAIGGAVTSGTGGSALFVDGSGNLAQDNANFYWDDTNNRIGFASTTPWAQLSVNPNGISGPSFAIGSSTSTSFVVTNGGDVGIGLTSPQTNFHINESNTDTTPSVEIEQLSTGDAALQFSISGDSYAIGIDNSDSDKFKISYAATAGTAVLGTDDRFVIDSTGNVGIGTSSPYAKLSVVGPVVASYFHATSTTATSTFAGNVEVGTGSGDSIFQFGADADAWSVGFLSSDKSFRIASSTGLTANVAFTIAKGGFVGFGSSTPSSRISILQTTDNTAGGIYLAATDADYRAIYMDTSQILNFIGGAGNTATLNAAGEWTNASDLAYKENIQDIQYGLDTVLALRPVSYDIVNSENLNRIGFIAQDVEQIIPEIVSGAEGSKGISYGNMIAVVVKAIQELSAKFDTFANGAIQSVSNQFDILFSNRVHTKEICIDDICLDRNELEDVLEKVGAGIRYQDYYYGEEETGSTTDDNGTTTDSGNDTGTSTDSGNDTGTSTDDSDDTTGTSTPDNSEDDIPVESGDSQDVPENPTEETAEEETPTETVEEEPPVETTEENETTEESPPESDGESSDEGTIADENN